MKHLAYLIITVFVSVRHVAGEFLQGHEAEHGAGQQRHRQDGRDPRPQGGLPCQYNSDLFLYRYYSSNDLTIIGTILKYTIRLKIDANYIFTFPIDVTGVI